MSERQAFAEARRGSPRVGSFRQARTPGALPDPHQALRALHVHERLASELPSPDGQAQERIFFAAFILLATAAAATSGELSVPHARTVRQGAAAINLGAEETAIALGFVTLLGARGWARFSVANMLDWVASVRRQFIAAQVSAGSAPVRRRHRWNARQRYAFA
jgi:hypothetical protein